MSPELPVPRPLQPAAAPSHGSLAYQEALARLYRRTGGAWRLGLERITELLAKLGAPHGRYPVFHVAGTNGKGSTVATLDALLRSAGLRVGRYTSPHLVDFSERVVVDGVPMSHAAITEWLATWEPELVRLGATFFEATTAMALAHFAAADVDVAVVEVGLGGRLDATNIVRPVAAAVTQIGYDHMEYLGATLEAIAGEKAGIFKRGAPAIIGETRAEIRDVLTRRAIVAGASPVLVTGRDWTVGDIYLDGNGTRFSLRLDGRDRQLTTPLIGAFQAHNAAVALAMLHAGGGRWRAVCDDAERSLAAVRLAGRFHRAGRWLFDVAHNPDGAATVVANLLAVGMPRPIVAVVSVLRDKDWRGIIEAVGRVADRVLITLAPTAPEARAWNLEEVSAWAAETTLPIARVDDFDGALRMASDGAATILVTGSFHTVGDAMERLQVDPLAR